MIRVRYFEYLSYEFGPHLKQCGIVPQLTPPGTPQRNGVSERRNHTLLDMVYGADVFRICCASID